jgi:hypothetical protein
MSGKITPETYIEFVDTQFPVYTSKLIELLKNCRNVEILQIEPYLEEVERLKNFNEGSEEVREMERKVNLAWLDYTEAFLKKDFDAVVTKVIEFARMDAERFVVRDRMRAREIESYENAVIEAGVMHVKLAEILDADTISIPEMIADILNTTYIDPPGNEITKAFIHDLDCEEKLLAARSLIYVSLVEKREMLPEPDNPFPHFVHEQKIIRFVNRLDYEKCRRIFEKLWYHPR